MKKVTEWSVLSHVIVWVLIAMLWCMAGFLIGRERIMNDDLQKRISALEQRPYPTWHKASEVEYEWDATETTDVKPWQWEVMDLEGTIVLEEGLHKSNQ